MRFFGWGCRGISLRGGARQYDGESDFIATRTLIEEVGISLAASIITLKIEEMIKKALVVAVMLLAAMRRSGADRV